MYSKDLRLKISEAYDIYKSYRAVAKIFNIHHFTVKRIVENLYVEEKEKPGPKKITTRRDESNIKKAVNRISGQGAKVTARKVKNESGLNAISTRTMQRRLKDMDLTYGNAKIKIIHSKIHKENRLSFARNCIANSIDWTRVIFTDEKRFNADGPDSWASWMPKNAQLVRNKRQQGGPSVQVWGMIIPGPLLLVFELPFRGDSETFMDFIEHQVLPVIKELFGENFIFQQDGAPTHTSIYSRSKFNDLGVRLLDWPSRSPDLNIIENCWSMISNIVYDGKQYSSANELWAAIDSAVSFINAHQQEALVRLFNSIPKRLLECIELKGALTHY